MYYKSDVSYWLAENRVKRSVPLNVEAKNLDAIIVLSIYCLLPCIELLAFVNVLSARITSPNASPVREGDT